MSEHEVTEVPRIAIFGGTFDPVHNGHLELVQKAFREIKLDQIILVPCRRSPHKEDNPGAEDHQRFRMLEIAFEDHPSARVSDYELKKPPPSFTWETVGHFKSRFPPNARFFLLIGLDQWDGLPRWKNIETLSKDVEFIVVGRSGHPEPRSGYRAHFIQGNHPASASRIRQDLAAGKPPRWLPESVADYILKKGLYSPAP